MATATYLDIWLMRRVVNYIRVGYSSVSYTMWLLCRDIRRKPLPDLVSILQEKLASDDVTFEGSAAKGRHGIADLGLNQFSRRYIFHLLARLTAFTEVKSGRSDSFDKYVDRDVPNPFDVEHIWPDDYSRFRTIFESAQDFADWRNHIPALLLLPADVNRSLQDKSFAEKLPHYAKQNCFAASLGGSAYQHQPQFGAFRSSTGLPFKPYKSYGKTEQEERAGLILGLANLVWSPDRLREFVA